MINKTTRPNWLILYLLVGIILLVFYLEIKMTFTRTGHIWAEIGLVLLLFGLVARWFKANEAALMREDWDKSKTYDQRIPAQSHHSSDLIAGVGETPKNSPNLRRSLSWYTGWSVPAWLSAIWSYLGDFFHRLPWLQ